MLRLILGLSAVIMLSGMLLLSGYSHDVQAQTNSTPTLTPWETLDIDEDVYNLAIEMGVEDENLLAFAEAYQALPEDLQARVTDADIQFVYNEEEQAWQFVDEEGNELGAGEASSSFLTEYGLENLDQTIQSLGEGDISISPRPPIQSESGMITTVETRRFTSRFPQASAENTMLQEEQYLELIEATIIYNALDGPLGNGFDQALFDQIVTNPEQFYPQLEQVTFQIHTMDAFENNTDETTTMNMRQVVENGIVFVRMGRFFGDQADWIPRNTGVSGALVIDDQNRLVIFSYRDDITTELNTAAQQQQERVTFDLRDYSEVADMLMYRIFREAIGMDGSETADAIMPLINPFFRD